MKKFIYVCEKKYIYTLITFFCGYILKIVKNHNVGIGTNLYRKTKSNFFIYKATKKNKQIF